MVLPDFPPLNSNNNNMATGDESKETIILADDNKSKDAVAEGKPNANPQKRIARKTLSMRRSNGVVNGATGAINQDPVEYSNCQQQALAYQRAQGDHPYQSLYAEYVPGTGMLIKKQRIVSCFYLDFIYSSTSFSPNFLKKIITASVAPLNNNKNRKPTSNSSTSLTLLNTTNKRFLELRKHEVEQQYINSFIVPGTSNEEEILFELDLDSVRRKSMHTLRPGQWLNDEIIHYYYNMLSKRDAELCLKDPTRLRSHFFRSFFMTALMNNEAGNLNCGQYKYENVKKWSEKVPGKDIFNLDKIFVPININQRHWIVAVIFIQEKKIEIFDSLKKNDKDYDGGKPYLYALFRYIQDDHLDKKKYSLADINDWELVSSQWSSPQQVNGTYNKYL
jgi:sentrin-specific protease 1